MMNIAMQHGSITVGFHADCCSKLFYLVIKTHIHTYIHTLSLPKAHVKPYYLECTCPDLLRSDEKIVETKYMDADF